MLAILAALTEVIKERGGSQTSTEYFLALMETIENSKDANDTVAAVSLLAMGIKTVPQAILRKKFSDVGQILLDLMERFVDSDNINILRSIIGCLSVLLRAQEYSQWQMPKTSQFFDTILTFVTHTKPRIRKAAQHAIVSILFGSSFMVPPKPKDDNEVAQPAPVKLHPASGRVAKFCVAQFKPENVANNQTIVLHTLGLLQSAMASFNKDDIKAVSEHLLSIMTSTNLLIRTTGFQTFHHLFQSKSDNLTAPLTGKLIAALYEYRPDKTDTQTLAWLTVLKEAHIFLATTNRQMCSNALPKFVEVCCTDLWLSDKVEIINGASNVLRELFLECVGPCCETADEADKHRVSVDKVLEIVGKTLSAPFGPATKYILSLYAVIFEVCGRHFGETLATALATLGRRYDPESANRLQIEHTVLAAIGTVDTKIVLTHIPLHEPSGEMSMNRSWLLPLLRQGLNGSSLELFNNYVLKLAYACYTKWQKLKELNNVTQSHLNELLCCQLWGLFPGFCRRPRDIGNFKLLAKTLGTVLNENPDLRAPILDGFIELIPNLATDDEKHEVGKFAKNFLPRLFNIYTTKPKGSYENEIRQQAFEVIRVYLAITPQPVLREMFTTAMAQFQGKSPGTFLHDMLFDIVETLALHQPKDVLDNLYDQFIVKMFAKEKSKMEEKGKVDFNVRRQLKKAYKLLLNILDADKPACVEFVAEKLDAIEELLLGAVDTTFEATQALRLACLKHLLLKQPDLTTETNLLHQVIPEVVLAFSNETVKKDNTATDMIRIIGDTFEQEQKLNEFVDVLLMGFVGDTVIVTNTIWVLKDLVAELTGHLTVDSLKFIIEQVVEFVTSNNRKEAEASVTFLVTFTKVLPPPLVANHLSIIVRESHRLSRTVFLV
jgi:ribosomal RNA-processing protein 12